MTDHAAHAHRAVDASRTLQGLAAGHEIARAQVAALLDIADAIRHHGAALPLTELVDDGPPRLAPPAGLAPAPDIDELPSRADLEREVDALRADLERSRAHAQRIGHHLAAVIRSHHGMALDPDAAVLAECGVPQQHLADVEGTLVDVDLTGQHGGARLIVRRRRLADDTPAPA